jgi:UMF1 family MFS transporter
MPDGKTLLGRAPVLGLDGAAREGTRFVGPFVALVVHSVFMIPFFVGAGPAAAPGRRFQGHRRHAARSRPQPDRALPRHRSRLSYLLAALFYRDALNGMFTFGGIYALGVLGWSVTDIGVFGILAAVTGAIFAWAGGKADDRFGPKPVIVACIWASDADGMCGGSDQRTAFSGISVADGSPLPSVAFYIAGLVSARPAARCNRPAAP